MMDEVRYLVTIITVLISYSYYVMMRTFIANAYEDWSVGDISHVKKVNFSYSKQKRLQLTINR